jgi:ABC-2 type transport system permease protein
MPESSYATTLPATRDHGRVPVWTEAQTMILRALRLSLRNPEALSTALALPIILMLMFRYLFGGAIHTGIHYVNYVVPGVLLVCVGFGAATTAVNVSHDLTSGIIDRFRSMDLRGETLINGHVLASVLRNILSSALVVAVAVAIGFRPQASPLGWLAAIGILTLWVLAVSWFAAAIGILAHSPDTAQGITFLISFLPYPSSAFVPISTMPPVLRAFANNQPVTAVVNAIRALLNGAPAGANVWHAIAWSIAIIVASVALAGALYRRRAR